MQVTIKDEYVDSYATIGELTGGIEVSEPTNMEYFENHFKAYKCGIGNTLIFDAQRARELESVREKEELRRRRETECFAVVDRSRFWYDSLTTAQYEELQTWYNAWLQVTETHIIPVRPEWL